MGRESSHGTKELFNLPPLVLKARHPMMALPFALDFLGTPMVMKINFLNFHVKLTCTIPSACQCTCTQCLKGQPRCKRMDDTFLSSCNTALIFRYHQGE